MMEISDTKTYIFESGCGNLYVSITHDNFKPKAVFLQNRSGCQSTIQMLGMLISQQLKDGKPIEEIARTLRKGSPCGACSGLDSRTKSCAGLIASALLDFKKMYMEKENAPIVGMEVKIPQNMENLDHNSGLTGFVLEV